MDGGSIAESGSTITEETMYTCHGWVEIWESLGDEDDVRFTTKADGARPADERRRV